MNAATDNFNKALQILEFHLGPHHLLYSTIYQVLGFYYQEVEKYEEAILFFKKSLVCCLRVLGSNHLYVPSYL